MKIVELICWSKISHRYACEVNYKAVIKHCYNDFLLFLLFETLKEYKILIFSSTTKKLLLLFTFKFHWLISFKGRWSKLVNKNWLKLLTDLYSWPCFHHKKVRLRLRTFFAIFSIFKIKLKAITFSYVVSYNQQLESLNKRKCSFFLFSLQKCKNSTFADVDSVLGCLVCFCLFFVQITK